MDLNLGPSHSSSQESGVSTGSIRLGSSASSLPKSVLALHEKALELSRSMRTLEAALIEVILEIDKKRVFVKMGYASLFAYAVQALGLSEGLAYNIITVSRKSRFVPELREEIQKGTITVSKAKKIASVITPKNQAEWIKKAQNLPTHALEREVAKVNPREATPERAYYVSGKRLQLTLGVEESLMMDLRRAQDRVSQARGKAASLEETLQELVGFYLQQKDPLEKARRSAEKKGRENNRAPQENLLKENSLKENMLRENMLRENPLKENLHQESAFKESAPETQTPDHPSDSLKTRFSRIVEKNDQELQNSPLPATSPLLENLPPLAAPSLAARSSIPARIQHAVRLRDQGRCQHKRPDGTRCGTYRWTDLHHIQPVSQGGAHSVENLITLCRAHHRELHRQNKLMPSLGPKPAKTWKATEAVQSEPQDRNPSP